ncbi:unnamed protein product, partial [Thlaspi arvense]
PFLIVASLSLKETAKERVHFCLMLKLFSWRRSAPQTLNLYSSTFFHKSLSPITLISRFLTQQQPLPEDPYDPPFSPTTKPLKPSKQKGRNKKKKQKKSQNESSTDSEEGKSFPLMSDLPFDFRYSYSETNHQLSPSGFANRRGSLLLVPEGSTANGPAPVLPQIRLVTWRRLQSSEARFSENRSRRRKFRSLWSDIVTVIVLGRLIWVLPPVLHPQLPLSLPPLSICNLHLTSDLYLQHGRKGGVTHNMIDDIHNHWKRAEAVRIKCLGVPTLDMDNVCFHLEDKSGGKIIYRHINILLLYRGRNYDPKKRSIIPIDAVETTCTYLSQTLLIISGCLIELEVDAHSCSSMSVGRNGVYVNVVERVREAFQTEQVIRLDCSYMGTSDCKKIGVKLRELVPCVPILFKDEQIILWRGKKGLKRTPVWTHKPEL